MMFLFTCDFDNTHSVSCRIIGIHRRKTVAIHQNSVSQKQVQSFAQLPCCFLVTRVYRTLYVTLATSSSSDKEGQTLQLLAYYACYKIVT